MDNTSSKTEYVKPVIFKICIPLALSAVGGISAMIMARSAFSSSSSEIKESVLKPKTEFRENENFYRQNSAGSLPSVDQEMSDIEDQNPNIEEVISGLNWRVQDLERKELEIERQFISYQNLKERESLLVELKNTLLLDMARISFLEKEILSMEEENKRFEGLVLEYLRVSEQLECQKSENKLLDREVKKLKKKVQEQSKVIREKNSKIESHKTQIWRNHDEMEAKKNVIEKLENEVKDLQEQLNQFQEQEENKTSSKSKAGLVAVEDYNRLADEIKELKEELLRSNEQKEKLVCEGNNEEIINQKEPSSDRNSITRRKFLQKIVCVGSNEKLKGKIRSQKDA